MGTINGKNDYYYAAIIIVFPAIILPFLWFIKTSISKNIVLKFINYVLAIGLMFCFIYSYNISLLRVNSNSQNLILPSLIDNQLVNNFRWFNYDLKKNYLVYDEMKKYTDSLGIKAGDKVICFDDDSFNRCLYLFNHEGWTGFMRMKHEDDVQNLINHGAKYLLIHKETSLEIEFLQKFIGQKIGEYVLLKFTSYKNTLTSKQVC